MHCMYIATYVLYVHMVVDKKLMFCNRSVIISTIPLCCKFEVYGVFYKSSYISHASTILVNVATTIKSCTIHQSAVLNILASTAKGFAIFTLVWVYSKCATVIAKCDIKTCNALNITMWLSLTKLRNELGLQLYNYIIV